MRAMLQKMRAEVEKNCDYVGPQEIEACAGNALPTVRMPPLSRIIGRIARRNQISRHIRSQATLHWCGCRQASHSGTG
jgi:hypothetical protein